MSADTRDDLGELYFAQLVQQGLLLVVGKRRGRCTYRLRPWALEWFEVMRFQ
jgi:hypothetical protein